MKTVDPLYQRAPTHVFERRREDRGGGAEGDGILTSVLPTCDDDESEIAARRVEYSDRAPGEFVISGPLPGGGGPGRKMETPEAAWAWVMKRYPDCSPRPVLEAFDGGRWAYVVSTETSKRLAS